MSATLTPPPRPCDYDECPSCGGWKKRRARRCIKCAYPRPVIVQPHNPAIRYIALTQGKVAIVDFVDYERLNRWRWCAVLVKGGKWYAIRRVWINSNDNYAVLMHREILGAASDIEVDHQNGNGLDNRRSNIRIATHSQNGMNKGITSRNRSGYKGVSMHPCGKWQARIAANKQEFHLGLFDSPELAFEAYRKKAVELHGEFAKS